MGTKTKAKQRKIREGVIAVPSRAADTVEEIIRWSEGEMARREIEAPRHNAECLLAFCLGFERWRLYLDRHRRLTSAAVNTYRMLLARRLGRYPLQYLLGSVGFYSLEMKVDGRALIPRPETELLVVLALERLKALTTERPRVLDLGCGSGNIALAIDREFPECDICASDISPPALNLARENAESLQSPHRNRIRFRLGDLFDPWADHAASGFDLIVSNPPYLSGSALAAAPPEVRDYEPWLALDGGADGLDVIRRLIRESPDYLKPGGWLLLEIGAEQGKAVRGMVGDRGCFMNCEVVKDHSRRDRVVAARRK